MLALAAAQDLAHVPRDHSDWLVHTAKAVFAKFALKSGLSQRWGRQTIGSKSYAKRKWRLSHAFANAD
jgi:hypothetical protein